MAKTKRRVERAPIVSDFASCCLTFCSQPPAYRCIEVHETLVSGEELTYGRYYCVQHGREWAKAFGLLTPDEEERRRQDVQDSDDGRGHL